MKQTPVFYDPTLRRWKWFQRILAILLVLGMALICALALAIFSVPALSSSDLLVPQDIAHAGPEFARPGDTSNGSVQQQYNRAVVALDKLLPTATLQATPLPTLVPANPVVFTSTPALPHPAVISTNTPNPLPGPPLEQASPTATRDHPVPPGKTIVPEASATPTLSLTAQPTQPPSPTNPGVTIASATPTDTPRPLPTNARKPDTPTPLPTNPNPPPTDTPKAQGHKTPTSAPTSSYPTPTATQHPHGPPPRGDMPPAGSLGSLFLAAFHSIGQIFAPPAGQGINPPVPVQTAPADSLMIGFYVNWDENADTSLRQNIQQINRFMPEWLHLADAAGAIADDNLTKENQVLSTIRQTRPDLPIVPLVNSYDPSSGQWNSRQLGQMLDSSTARGQAIRNLLAFVQKNHMAGISIDFEDTPAASQTGLQAFMQALYAAFHPLGLEVALVVPAGGAAFDTRSLAPDCDYLIIMTIEEHWSGGKAGPVASQAWYQSALEQQVASAGAQKVVMAIGNYGYDWAGSQAGRMLTFQEAIQSAQSAGATIRFDPTALNPTFTYVDQAGQNHTVWYLDAVTAYNQIMAGESARVRGFALWRLGSEDPSIWQALSRRASLGVADAQALSLLDFGYAVRFEGQGEILKVSGVPAAGSRAITLDPQTGMIQSEKMTAFPSSYLVTRWGRKEKEIALTFDDGPDPVYTPQILEILQKYQAPAAFFIIGINGQQHPELLQRIYRDGYEIGVHTFSHPDISTISPEQLRLELNATQLLLESQLEVRTILFRPPYGTDAEPRTPQEVKPLVIVGQMGYYTIGMQIDPADWQKPGVQAIVDKTLSQAGGDGGNIIVLHDGGGDRSQTVLALPKIIEALRAQGYRLVSLADLMGLTPAQVMPAVPKNANLQTGLGLLGFSMIDITTNLSSILFMVCTVIGIGRMLFINSLAIIQWIRSEDRLYPKNYRPLLSVLVPAYNEAKVINKTVNSLLRSTYPNLEILVIDDGSTDGTYDCVRSEFPDEPRLRVYRKPNGGKASALNFGIGQAEGEIIVVLDADTVILSRAIARLVRHMSDPRVCAVAGNAKVGNRDNGLTRMQALEYITSQNMDRRAFALLNCITVVPGAIGAWRKDQVVQVGGFKTDTLAEDADLTLHLLRSGIRIEYEDRAIAMTEAPETLKSFLKQRFRWMFGMLQTTWKQKDAIFKPRFGAMGLVALPNIVVFSIVLPLISPIMDLTFVWSFASWVVYRFQHPEDANFAYLLPVLGFYVFYLVVDLFTGLLAFIMEPKEDLRLIFWLLPQRILYRQLMYYTSIRVMLSALRGQAVGWGKLERKASVKG